MFLGKSRQDQSQKYLGLLWSLTGQKFRRNENPDANEDGLSCCSRWKKWFPSGFDLVDILGIVYHSMPKDEELRRLFTRLIDAEMLRRLQAQQQDVEPGAKDAMQSQENQASHSNGRFCTGRRPLRRQEAVGIGGGRVSGNDEPVRSGDLRHGGDVGLQDCDLSRNCLRYKDMERGAADSCQTKNRSAWSGIREGSKDTSAWSGFREGSKERRLRPVAGRRTYGRMWTDKDKSRRTKDQDGHLMRQNKQSEQQQQAILRKAAAVTKTIVQCIEGQSHSLDCFAIAEDAADGESPNRNRTKRLEPVRVTSSASYTVCTSPRQDAATFEEPDAQRVAEDGADGERTKKYSGHKQRSPVI